MLITKNRKSKVEVKQNLKLDVILYLVRPCRHQKIHFLNSSLKKNIHLLNLRSESDSEHFQVAI